jgi:chitinase
MEKTRKLSPWRVMLAILILAGLAAGGVFGARYWEQERSRASSKPWFAAYVDVTSTPSYAFEQAENAPSRDVILSFIVASPKDACTPSWGGAYTLDQAGDNLDLDRRIARLKQQKGNVAVSFGGLKNNELAMTCTDADRLAAAYRSVIERYQIDTIDLDIETTALADTASNERRALAIAKLQKEYRAKGKSLAVWATLPVVPQGLSPDGINVVSILLKKGVDLAGVNVMTMAYGESRKGMKMLDASKKALKETHRQLGILYDRAGLHQNSRTLWSKIGATPMIGQNDFVEEVFTLKDAKAFNDFARSRGVGRMSMWSANRDIACGSNYVDVKVVSDSCSGVAEDKYAFTAALRKGFDGSFSLSAGKVTKKQSVAKIEEDDPETSPYPIWTEDAAYLEGAKVVWHRNVYQAKWWTQGDLPDSPVLQIWQTPWELLGPVLPGEKPIEQPTLPAGTYPEWKGTDAYEAGVRVLFKGVPYQAKWWNKGASPAAASSNPDSSPWVPLTQAQIIQLIEDLEKEKQQ